MTKISNTVKRTLPEKRSFRRWIKQLFESLIGRSGADMDEVKMMFQEIQDSLDIIAREIARQATCGKK